MNKFLNLFILFLTCFVVIEASHFRFGTISWQPSGTYNTIKFSTNFAYRITYFKSLNSIAIGDSISVGTLQYGFKTGSTTESVSVVVKVTSFSKDDDWFTGEYSVTKTYPTVTKATTYTTIFTSCCRISTLLNNADGDWNITSALVIDPNQGTDQTKWNHSPVSGLVPIITLNRDKVNNFLVVASDPDLDTLTYSLSTVYKMTQPTGISIDSTSGMVTFTPTKIGLYSTQIYIADTRGAYIVVDFLINSIVEAGVCHSSCSNANVACNGNSDCKSCTSSDTTGNTCTSNPPTWIRPPTPTNGYLYNFSPNVTGNFSFSCETSDSSKTVTIQTANVPTGSKLITSTTNSQKSTLYYQWTPDITQVGSYVISASCTDNKGLVSSVTSFSISVQKPTCGNGKASTTIAGQCDCDEGWDPTKNCYECKATNYGEKCLKAPDCFNGVLNNGTTGDGVCTCYYGWEGTNCNITVSQVCNSNSDNSVLSYTNTDPSYYNPTFAQIYLNTASSKTALTMPTKLSIPYPLTMLDILFVMDAQPSTTYVWNSVATYMGQFITKVTGLCEKTNFALGFFSDATSGYPFQLSRVSGDNIDVFNTLSPDAYSTSSTKNSAEALSAASVYATGWVKGTLKIIVLITDNDHAAPTSVLTTLTNNLVEQSILPIVVGMGTDVPNWASLFTSQGFGVSKKATATSINIDWVNQAYQAIQDVLVSVPVKVLNDPYGFATVSSSSVSLNINSKLATNANIDVKIKYPQGVSVPDFPVILYSVVGFGTTKVIINYNHAPTSSNSYITTKQNVNADFYLTGYDMDANTLSVRFTSIPSTTVGTIKSGSTVVKSGDSFLVSTKFTFVPTQNYYTKSGAAADTFTFVVNDGCLDSGSSTVTINIDHVNQAPSCNSLATIVKATSVGSSTSFTLTGSDIETDSTLSIVFGDISSISSYATISSSTSGSAIASNSKITLASGSASFTLIQTKNIATSKNYSISFKVNDGELDSASQCTFNVGIVHFNDAPVASAVTPISVRPLSTTTLTISASDSDSQQVKFSIKSLIPGDDAYFFSCSGGETQVLSTAFNSNLLSLVSTKANYQDICYKAPSVNGNSYGTLVFSVIDDENAESSQFTVKINVVGQRDNAAPVVIPIPDFSMNEDDVSSLKQIDGTDTDSADQGNLVAIILSSPINGILSTTPRGSSAAVSGDAPYGLYYTPNELFYGTDSFTYTVEDTMGARAEQSVTTTITVNHVNHAPTLSISSYSFTSQTSSSAVVLNLDPKDVDNDSPLVCKVVGLPSKLIIKQSNGVAISINDVLVDNKYIITADPTMYSSISGDSFKASCSDPSGLDSNIAIGLIDYRYINIPPVANSSTVTMNQDTPLDITVIATDLESQSTLRVLITSLPTHGTLVSKSTGLSIDLQTSYQLNDFVYTPTQGYSNIDTSSQQGPADSFSFIAKDNSGDTSSVATVSISINPRNPPTYTGVTVLYTKENTDLPIIITGEVGKGGSNVYLKILSIVSNGTLYSTHCMGTEGCVVSGDAITAPYTSKNIDGSYSFSFSPVQYENGDNYATIQFVLFDIYDDEEYDSGYYTIIINVSPVNQAPVVQLIDYTVFASVVSEKQQTVTFPSTNTINMDVNSSVIIKYDGSDIDNPKSELTSYLYNLPLFGKVYLYEESATKGLGREVTVDDRFVPIANDGYWYIVYVPTAGSSGTRYARIPITIQDSFDLESEPATAIVNVNKKNVAPIITIENRNYTGFVNNQISVLGVSFVDPDSIAIINNASLTVSLLDSNDQLVSNENASLTFYSNLTSCIQDATYVSFICNDNKKYLNTTLTTIKFKSSVAGSYRIKLFVDDLGYNAPTSIRDISHMNATDYVVIQVDESDTTKTTTTSTNKTVLTGAIAGAAAGAAIVAGGLWALMKKRMPPTDTFFGGEADFSQGVSTNPLYQQSANSAVNPLYEASTD